MTSVFPAVSGFISGLPLAPLSLALSLVVTYYDIWLLMAQQPLVPDFRNFSSHARPELVKLDLSVQRDSLLRQVYEFAPPCQRSQLCP